MPVCHVHFDAVPCGLESSFNRQSGAPAGCTVGEMSTVLACGGLHVDCICICTFGCSV